MNQLIKMQKGITEAVGKRIKVLEDEGLALPEQYSAKNALSSAFFTLQKVYGIEKATQESIANALLDMVTQGLSPAKTQCYFIVYGNELQMQRSYFGTVAALKRLSNVDKVKAEVIHEGDVFEIGSNEDMEMIVTKFEPKFENMNKPIIGAFAMIKLASGEINYTVMTKEEIDKSWQQSRNKNNKVQQNFGQEMAKRTVLNRAAKMFINTSDDSDLLTGAINNTTENEFEREEPKEIQAQEKQADDLIKKAIQKPEEPEQKKVEELEDNQESEIDAADEVIGDTKPDIEPMEVESDENQTELFDEFGLIK
ncbi:recombinase RecT [Ligilactobacillus salivarius]|uniref:Recombinase RecT n=1 Tax=Ligilactobacillus salivarius TaxID=1624 RepID=A0A1Y0F8F7_9LACO|nr:RecT family recombinase [Ligilactobacillus salivarius]ARU19649.1 recombinase RecT [Ligilactobacillus salivarius]UHL93213.1 recombinase RecT [Ligilactobacillus salivarius]